MGGHQHVWEEKRNPYEILVRKPQIVIYRHFNIHKFHVLPTQCIYVFCVDLRTNSDYFPIQH